MRLTPILNAGGSAAIPRGPVYSNGILADGGVVPPTPGPGLQALSLSAIQFSQASSPGVELATINGKTAGSTIEIIGGNGRLVTSKVAGKVHKGLIGCTPGEIVNFTLREIHPDYPPKDTALSMIATGLTPLDPMAASQAPVALYSLRRMNPAYVGNCLSGRNSVNGTFTLGFNADGTLNTSGLSASGDGVTFTVATWFDQSGQGRDLTFSTRAKLIFPNAPANYDGAYLDLDTSTMCGATAATFLDVGGTANLAAFVSYARFGFGGAYSTSRPGVATTGAKTALLGFGTAATGILMGGCPTLGNGQADKTGFRVNNDSLGRSVSAYDRPEHLSLDEGTPAVGSAFTNAWFNQKGALVTGGGDSRRHWSDREHGVAAATGQRLVVGGAGNLGNAFNGGIKEVILYQSATAMSDDEAQRIAIGQHARWSTVPTIWGNRYFMVGLGQSNINGQFTHTTSGDGNTLGTDAINRRFRPKFADALGIPAERILAGANGQTMRGGTAVLKRPMPGDAARDYYFWDEDTNDFGNLWTGVDGSNNGNAKGFLDAILYLKYKRIIIVFGQGEEDAASSMTGAPRLLQWAQQCYAYAHAVRTYLGQPEAPIVIQPLARYDGGKPNVNPMRRLQASYFAAQPNCFLAADTGHLARGATGAQYISHLGSMAAAASGGFDPTTGTAEDGYQRAAWQNAKAAANAIHIVQGRDLALPNVWRGPEAVSAVKSGANTIDVKIAYPYGCGGTDFSTPSGQIGGFRAFTSGGDLPISSVAKMDATTVRLTLAAAVPASGVSVVYEPNFASGNAEGSNVRNQIVDNNGDLPMPLATSPVLTLAA